MFDTTKSAVVQLQPTDELLARNKASFRTDAAQLSALPTFSHPVLSSEKRFGEYAFPNKRTVTIQTAYPTIQQPITLDAMPLMGPSFSFVQPDAPLLQNLWQDPLRAFSYGYAQGALFQLDQNRQIQNVIQRPERYLGLNRLENIYTNQENAKKALEQIRQIFAGELTRADYANEAARYLYLQYQQVGPTNSSLGVFLKGALNSPAETALVTPSFPFSSLSETLSSGTLHLLRQLQKPNLKPEQLRTIRQRVRYRIERTRELLNFIQNEFLPELIKELPSNVRRQLKGDVQLVHIQFLEDALKELVHQKQRQLKKNSPEYQSWIEKAAAAWGLLGLHLFHNEDLSNNLVALNVLSDSVRTAASALERARRFMSEGQLTENRIAISGLLYVSALSLIQNGGMSNDAALVRNAAISYLNAYEPSLFKDGGRQLKPFSQLIREAQQGTLELRALIQTPTTSRALTTQRIDKPSEQRAHGGRILNYPILDGDAKTGWRIPSLSDYVMRSMELMDTVGEQRVERLVNALRTLDLKAFERYKREVVVPKRVSDEFGFQDSPREKPTRADAVQLFETVVIPNLRELKKLVETGGIVRHWGSVRALYYQTKSVVNQIFPKNSAIHTELKPIFDAIESVNDGLERTAALKGIGSPRLNGLQYVGLVYGDSLLRLAKNAVNVGLLPRASLMVDLGRRTIGELSWDDLKLTNWQDAAQRELLRSYLTQNFSIALSEMGDMTDILLQLPTNEIGRAMYHLIGGRTGTYHPYFIENILPGASREYIEFGSRFAQLAGVAPETGQFLAAMFLSSGVMNPGAIVSWLLPSTFARVGSFAGSSLLKIGSAIGRGGRVFHRLGKIGNQIAHISQRLTPDLIGGLAVAGRGLGWSARNLYQTMQFFGNIGDVADAALMGGDWSTVLSALAFSPETLLTLKSEIGTRGPAFGTLAFLLPDVANAAQFGKRVYETAKLLRSIEAEAPKLSWDSFTEGTLQNFSATGRALAFDLQDRKLVQTEGFATPDKSRVLVRKGEITYERPTQALVLMDPTLLEKAKQSQPRMALSILMGLWMRDQQKNPYALTTESLTALFGPDVLQTLNALKTTGAVQTQVEGDGTETIRLTDAGKQLMGLVFDESIPAKLWLQYLRDRYGAQIQDRDAVSLVQMLDQMPDRVKARLSLGVKLSVLERMLDTLETAQSGVQAIESVDLATRTDNATRIQTIVAKDGSYAYVFTDNPLDPIEQPLLKIRLKTDAKAIPGVLETVASAIEELVGQNASAEVVGYKALPDGGSELIVQIDTENGLLKEPSLKQAARSLNRALDGLKTQLRQKELNAESGVKSVLDALSWFAPGGAELGVLAPTTRTVQLTPPSLPKHERLMTTPRPTRGLTREERLRERAMRRQRIKAQQTADLENEAIAKLQQTEEKVVLDLSSTLLRFAQNAALRKAAFTEPIDSKVAVWRFETEHESLLRGIQALKIALRSESPVQAMRQIYRQARVQTIASIIQHYAGALQETDYEALAAAIQETPETGWKRLYEAIDGGLWHEPMDAALRSETAFEYLKKTAKPSLKAILEPYQTLEAFLQDLGRLLLDGETGYARVSAIRHLLGVVQTLALLSSLPKSQIAALETHEILEATVEAALALPIRVLERIPQPAWQALAAEKRELFKQIASRLIPIESIRAVGVPDAQIEAYQDQLIVAWPRIEAAIWQGDEERLTEILKGLEWFRLVFPAQGSWTNDQTAFQALASLWINEFKTHTHEAQTLARIREWLSSQPKNELDQSPGRIVLEGFLQLGRRAYYTVPIQYTTETGESIVRPAIVRLVASQNQPAFLVEEALHYLHYRWSQELNQLASLHQPLGLSPAFVKFSQLVHYLTEDRAQEEIRDAYIRYGLEMIEALSKRPNTLSGRSRFSKAMTYFEQVFHEGGVASHLMEQALQRYTRGLTIGALAPAYDAAYIRHGLSWRIGIQRKAIETSVKLAFQENTENVRALASQLPLGLFHEDAPLTESIYQQPSEQKVTPLENLRGFQNYLHEHWSEGKTLSAANLTRYIKTQDDSLLNDALFLKSLEMHFRSVGLVKAFDEGRYLTTHLESVMDYTPPQQPSQQQRYRIRKRIGQSMIEIEPIPSLTPETIRFLYQRERIRKQFLYRLFVRTVESHFSLAEKIQETINDHWVDQLNRTVHQFLVAQQTNDLQTILANNLLRESLSKAIEPLLQAVIGISYTQEPSERRTIDTYLELPVQVNGRLYGITVHVRSHPESGVRDLFSPMQFTIISDSPRDLSVSLTRYEQLLWMGASNNQRALASSLLVGKRLRSRDGKQYVVQSVQMAPNGQMIALVSPDKPIRPLQETRPFIESKTLFDLSAHKPKPNDALSSVWPIGPSVYIFDERLLIEKALKNAKESKHIAFQALTDENLAFTLKHSVILQWLLTTVLKTIDQIPDCGLYFKADEEGYRVLLPNQGYARQRPSLEAFEGIKKSAFLERIERLEQALNLLEKAPPVHFVLGSFDTETVLEQSTLEPQDLAVGERARRVQLLIQGLKEALAEIKTALQNAPNDARVYSFALSATASVLPIESFLNRWQLVAEGRVPGNRIETELKFHRELRPGAFEPVYRLGRPTSAELTFMIYELLSNDDPFILQLAMQTELVDPFLAPHETLASLGLTYEERDLGVFYPRITKPEALAKQLQTALLEITHDPAMAQRMTDQAVIFAITGAHTEPYQSGGVASPITLGALPSLKFALIRIDGQPLIGKLFVSGGLYDQLEATGKNVYVFPVGYDLLKKRVEGRGVPIQLELFADAVHNSDLVVETEVRTPAGMMTIDPREVALQIATLYNLGRVETIQEVVKSMKERYPFIQRLYTRLQYAPRLSLTETTLVFLQALRAKQFIFPIDLSLSAYARVIVMHPPSDPTHSQRVAFLIKAQQNDFLNRLKETRQFSSDVIGAFENFFLQPETDTETFMTLFHLLIGLNEPLQETILEALFESMGTLNGLPKFMIPIFTDTLIESHADVFNFAIGLYTKLSQKQVPLTARQTIQAVLEWSFNPFIRQTIDPNTHQTIARVFRNLLTQLDSETIQTEPLAFIDQVISTEQETALMKALEEEWLAEELAKITPEEIETIRETFRIEPSEEGLFHEETLLKRFVDDLRGRQPLSQEERRELVLAMIHEGVYDHLLEEAMLASYLTPDTPYFENLLAMQTLARVGTRKSVDQLKEWLKRPDLNDKARLQILTTLAVLDQETDLLTPNDAHEILSAALETMRYADVQQFLSLLAVEHAPNLVQALVDRVVDQLEKEDNQEGVYTLDVPPPPLDSESLRAYEQQRGLPYTVFPLVKEAIHTIAAQPLPVIERFLTQLQSRGLPKDVRVSASLLVNLLATDPTTGASYPITPLLIATNALSDSAKEPLVRAIALRGPIAMNFVRLGLVSYGTAPLLEQYQQSFERIIRQLPEWNTDSRYRQSAEMNRQLYERLRDQLDDEPLGMFHTSTPFHTEQGRFLDSLTSVPTPTLYQTAFYAIGRTDFEGTYFDLDRIAVAPKLVFHSIAPPRASETPSEDQPIELLLIRDTSSNQFWSVHEYDPYNPPSRLIGERSVQRTFVQNVREIGHGGLIYSITNLNGLLTTTDALKRLMYPIMGFDELKDKVLYDLIGAESFYLNGRRRYESQVKIDEDNPTPIESAGLRIHGRPNQIYSWAVLGVYQPMSLRSYRVNDPSETLDYAHYERGSRQVERPMLHLHVASSLDWLGTAGEFRNVLERLIIELSSRNELDYLSAPKVLVGDLQAAKQSNRAFALQEGGLLANLTVLFEEIEEAFRQLEPRQRSQLFLLKFLKTLFRDEKDEPWQERLAFLLEHIRHGFVLETEHEKKYMTLTLGDLLRLRLMAEAHEHINAGIQFIENALKAIAGVADPSQFDVAYKTYREELTRNLDEVNFHRHALVQKLRQRREVNPIHNYPIENLLGDFVNDVITTITMLTVSPVLHAAAPSLAAIASDALPIQALEKQTTTHIRRARPSTPELSYALGAAIESPRRFQKRATLDNYYNNEQEEGLLIRVLGGVVTALDETTDVARIDTKRPYKQRVTHTNTNHALTLDAAETDPQDPTQHKAQTQIILPTPIMPSEARLALTETIARLSNLQPVEESKAVKPSITIGLGPYGRRLLGLRFGLVFQGDYESTGEVARTYAFNPSAARSTPNARVYTTETVGFDPYVLAFSENAFSRDKLTTLPELVATEGLTTWAAQFKHTLLTWLYDLSRNFAWLAERLGKPKQTAFEALQSLVGDHTMFYTEGQPFARRVGAWMFSTASSSMALGYALAQISRYVINSDPAFATILTQSLGTLLGTLAIIGLFARHGAFGTFASALQAITLRKRALNRWIERYESLIRQSQTERLDLSAQQQATEIMAAIQESRVTLDEDQAFLARMRTAPGEIVPDILFAPTTTLASEYGFAEPLQEAETQPPTIDALRNEVIQLRRELRLLAALPIRARLDQTDRIATLRKRAYEAATRLLKTLIEQSLPVNLYGQRELQAGEHARAFVFLTLLTEALSGKVFSVTGNHLDIDLANLLDYVIQFGDPQQTPARDRKIHALITAFSRSEFFDDPRSLVSDGISQLFYLRQLPFFYLIGQATPHLTPFERLLGLLRVKTLSEAIYQNVTYHDRQAIQALEMTYHLSREGPTVVSLDPLGGHFERPTENIAKTLGGFAGIFLPSHLKTTVAETAYTIRDLWNILSGGAALLINAGLNAMFRVNPLHVGQPNAGRLRTLMRSLSEAMVSPKLALITLVGGSLVAPEIVRTFGVDAGALLQNVYNYLQYWPVQLAVYYLLGKGLMQSARMLLPNMGLFFSAMRNKLGTIEVRRTVVEIARSAFEALRTHVVDKEELIEALKLYANQEPYSYDAIRSALRNSIVRKEDAGEFEQRMLNKPTDPKLYAGLILKTAFQPVALVSGRSGTSDPILAAIRAHEKSPIETFIYTITPYAAYPTDASQESPVDLNAIGYTIATLELNNETEARLIQQTLRELFSEYKAYANRNGTSVAFWDQLSREQSIQYQAAGQTSTGKTLYQFFVNLTQEAQPYLFDVFMLIEHMRSLRFMAFDRYAEFIKQSTDSRWLAEKAIEAAHQSLERLAKFYLAFIDPTYETLYVPENRFGLEIGSGGLHLPFGGETVIQHTLQSDLQRLGDAESVIETTLDVAKGKGEAAVALKQVEKALKRLFEIRKRQIEQGDRDAAEAAFHRLMTILGNQHYQREAELRDLAELKGGRQILSGTGVTQASPLEYGQDYLTTASKIAIAKSFLEKQTPLYTLDADLNVHFDPFEHEQVVENADWFLSKFVVQLLDTLLSERIRTELNEFGPPIGEYVRNRRPNLTHLAQAYDASLGTGNRQTVRASRMALIHELLILENALLESLVHNLRQLSLVGARQTVSFEEALSIAIHEIRRGGEGSQFLERLLRTFSVFQFLRVSLETLHEADQANLNDPNEALNALFALTVFNYSAQSLLIGLAYLTDAYNRASANAPIIRDTRRQLRLLQQRIVLFDADFLTLLDQLPSAAIGATLYNVFQRTKPTQANQRTFATTADAFDSVTLLENAVSTIRNISWLSTYLRDRINQKPTLATVPLRQENRRIYEAVRAKLLMAKALVEFITAQAATRLKFRSQFINRASGMLLQAPGFVKQILVSHFIQPYNFLQMVKTMLGAFPERNQRIRAKLFLPHRRIFAVAGLVTLLMAGSGWLTYQQLKHGFNAPLVFGDESGVMVQIHMNPNNPARFNTATVRVRDHKYQYTFDQGRFTSLIGQVIGNLNMEANVRSVIDYPAFFGEAIGNTLLGTLSEIAKGQTFAGFALTTGLNQLGFTSIRTPASGAPLLLLTEQDYINPSLPLLLAQRFYNSLPPIFFTTVTPREQSWFESILKNPQTDLNAVNAVLAAFGLNDPLQISAYDETTGGISPNTIFVQRGYMGGLQGDYHNQEIYEQVSKELYGFVGHRVQPAYQIEQDENGRWRFVPQDRSIQRETARITGGLSSWAAREMRSGGVRNEDLATETPFNILSIGQQLNTRYKPIRFHLSANVLAQNVQRDLEIQQKQVGGNQALVVEYFNPLMQTSLEPIVRDLGITSWEELKTALYGGVGYLAITTQLDHTPDQNKTIRTIAGYGVRELHYHSPITQTRVLIEAFKPQVENLHLLPGGVIHAKSPVVSRRDADEQQTEYDMVHRLINLNGYFMNLQTGPVIFVQQDRGRLVFENVDDALRAIETFGGLWTLIEGEAGRYLATPAFFKVEASDEHLRGVLVAKLALDGSIDQVGAFVIRSEGSPRVQSVGYYRNGYYQTLSRIDLRSMYSGAADFLKQRAIEATLNPALWDGLRDLPSDLVSAWQSRLNLPDAAVYQKLLIWYALIENRTDQWSLYSALENFTQEYYLPYGTQLIAETLHKNRVVAHAPITAPSSDLNQLRKIAQSEHTRLQRELNELREALTQAYQTKPNRSKVDQLAYEHALQKLDVFERTLIRFTPGSRRFNDLVSNMAQIVSSETIDAQAFAFGFQTALISDYLERLDKDAQGRFVGYRVYVPTRNPNRYAPVRIEKPSDPFSTTAAVALDYTLRRHRQLREQRVDTSRYAFVLEPTPDNWLSRLITTPFKR